MKNILVEVVHDIKIIIIIIIIIIILCWNKSTALALVGIMLQSGNICMVV